MAGAVKQDVGQAEPSTSNAPASEYASNLRQRAASATASVERVTAGATTEDSDSSASKPAPDPVAEALTRAVPAGKVSLPAAIAAAAFQTQALRMVMAVAAAVLAVMGQLSFAGVSPLLQLVASNVVITLSAAWMLTQQPERYQRLEYQMRIRGGGMVDKAFGLAQSLLGKPLVTQMKAALALAWGAYVDSGMYLAIVIALYLLQRGEQPVSGAGGMADKLRHVQQSFEEVTAQELLGDQAAGVA